MNKTLLYIFGMLLFSFMLMSGVSSIKNINQASSLAAISKIDSMPKLYFDYDEITYYYNSYDPKSDDNRYDRYSSKDKVDELKRQTLFHDYPTSINDLEFLDYMDKYGYIEHTLDTLIHKQANEIFIEKTYNYRESINCGSIYRHILVFKKKSKVVGVAKICFKCRQKHIIGTNAITDYFGMEGDYAKLQKLLKANAKEVKKPKKQHEIKLKY